MLDEIYRDKLPAVDGDSNSYIFGRIGKHNVVIASLPNKTYGISPVGEVVTQMSRSFAGLRVRLLVGIGGGVSRLIGKNAVDIRLGDVVVSYPTDYASGVIQYDLGKTIEGKEWPKRTGTLNKSLTFIRIVVTNLKMNHRLNGSSLDSHFSKMILQHSTLASEYTYQGEDNDILFEAGYRHESQGFTCAECFKSKSISRTPRQSNLPIIYYDLIASGNQVVKDSVTRDYWGNEEGVLCFEMEAAALMDVHPYLVIRGVCDYADSHKNKRWQSYAAATAAAYAKDLLLEIAPYAVQATESPFRGQPESGA